MFLQIAFYFYNYEGYKIWVKRFDKVDFQFKPLDEEIEESDKQVACPLLCIKRV